MFDVIFVSCLPFFYFFCVIYRILFFFFFSSRRRHTRLVSDWSSDVCSSDLQMTGGLSPRSVARSVAAVRGFYRFLVLDRRLEHSPADDLQAPRAWPALPKFQIGRASCRERV